MSGREPMLSTKQAAAYLGVHVETIRRLARRGDIPSFKVGKDWRFSKTALDLWASQYKPRPVALSVLIIDDEERGGKAICRQVERLGHRARHVQDGRTGLASIAEQPPDLVLLDLVMPGMNGPQVIEALRSAHPDLAVVITTDHPDSKLVGQALRHGPLILLAKPIENDHLLRALALIQVAPQTGHAPSQNRDTAPVFANKGRR